MLIAVVYLLLFGMLQFGLGFVVFSLFGRWGVHWVLLKVRVLPFSKIEGEKNI
jgi:hypothetical protein